MTQPIKQSATKAARRCLACGKPAAVVMQSREGDRATVCVSCAELLASELVMNEHGDHVKVWRAA